MNHRKPNELLLLIVITVTINTLIHSRESIRTYTVNKIERSISLSGKGDDPQWKLASNLTDFHYPWDPGTPSPTSFRALHDDHWLYCLFSVSDPAPYIHVERNRKTEVAASSRAEIFFKADDKLNPYYCLEIDPTGRVLDYEAAHYRKFNFEWSWPKDHLQVKTHRNTAGYSIEIAISKASLRQLGLLKGNTLHAGLFRGDRLPPHGGEEEFKWISWVRPDAETPDFHIPSSFGLLRLGE